MRARLRSLFDSPFLRRVNWHVKRVAEKIDKRFFASLLTGLAVFLSLAATSIWLAETDRSIGQLGHSYGAMSTCMSAAEPRYKALAALCGTIAIYRRRSHPMARS